jgi:HAMP domain-containing protein
VTTSPPSRALHRGLSFRLKITLLAVIVAVVPVVAVGWVASEIKRDAIGAVNRQMIAAVIENVTTTARATLGEADTTLTAIASVLENPDDTRAAVVEATLDGSRTVGEIGIYDADGARITTLESRKPFKPPPLPATLPAALRRNEQQVFGPAVVVAGQPFILRTFTIAKSRQYTVAAHVALRSIAESAAGLQTGSHGFTGHVVVVTPDRLAIADSLGERVGATLGSGEIAMLSMFDRGVLADKDVYSSGDYRTADGTAMVGALRTIDDTPFTVVVEVPYTVVFASIASMRRLVLVAVLIAVVIAVAAGVIFARRVTRPIKALVDYAGELAQRNFGSRVTIRTRDELGVLGDALERAATDLQASDEQISRERAIRSDLGSAERSVRASTWLASSATR